MARVAANGCNAENGLHNTVRCLALPAPQAVSLIELIKCSAKHVAKANAFAPKMVCLAPLCVNATADCTNTIIIREDIRDSESDDDESMIVILQCR